MSGNQETKPRHLERFSYTIDQTIEKQFNWMQMLRLLSYLKPYVKKLLPGAIIAMLFSTAIRLIVPILIGKVAIDIALANDNMRLLVILVVGICILYIISYIANIFRIKWVNILGQNVIYDLRQDRKSTRLNSSHVAISYAVFCLKKKNNIYKLSTRN